MYGGGEVQLHMFLTPELADSDPGPLTSRKRALNSYWLGTLGHTQNIAISRKTTLICKAIMGPSTQQFFSSSSYVIATICFGHTAIIK
jgi:hypothetical protein